MERRTDFIIPECYIDTNLVETLACAGGCNHQKGCNQVARIMQDKFADRFAVGIIDADKRRPGYLNEFTELCSSGHLKVFGHPKRTHFIILVHPAADGFIMACAGEAGINVADFGLPTGMNDFITQTKNVMSNCDVRFKRLFRAMESTGEMRLLKTLVGYLVDKTYKSSPAEISALFLRQQ